VGCILPTTIYGNFREGIIVHIDRGRNFEHKVQSVIIKSGEN
jgi:hypothetical protein